MSVARMRRVAHEQFVIDAEVAAAGLEGGEAGGSLGHGRVRVHARRECEDGARGQRVRGEADQ